MKNRKSLFLLLALLQLGISPSARADETISVHDAASLMGKIRDTCAPYVTNGEKFWEGEYQKASDAPGLLLLNKVIKQKVRKAPNVDAAKNIAWQECLDVVFNDDKSGN